MVVPPTLFLKLGGSLITDKTRVDHVRAGVLRRLAGEVRRALDAAPAVRLLIGHGSGAFGHQAARPYGTRQGVRTPEQWQGFARVSAAAARLDRIVADAMLEAGVPAVTLQPSASARCRDGVLEALETAPVEALLARGLVPLLYGDVALDAVRGGTIISTEDIFVFLAPRLVPQWILLAGEVAGVLDGSGSVVPRITPATLPALRPALTGARGVDVTGGMLDKVTRMVDLVAQQPALKVRILSGAEPGAIAQALTDPGSAAGTLITYL